MMKIIAVMLMLGMVLGQANSGLRHGKLDASNSVYFMSDGTPYQCGPMSYYGAICWQPDGIPNAPPSVKGFMWILVPEEAKK